MTSDWELLQRYVRAGDASAFAELVQRHVAVVYGRARRILGRDLHEAEDVTQAVFILLSQKAKRLRKVDSLAGWLYRATGFCCANAQRRERRRHQHERRVAVDVQGAVATEETAKLEASMVLDEGLEQLKGPEREAILLRYFENLTAAQSGAAVGASAEAVEKRLQRGIEKLRRFFEGRGYAINLAGVGQVLATEGARQVPAGLAGKVAGGVVLKVGVAAGIAKETATWLGWMRVKVAGAMLGGVGIVVGLGVGTL